MLTSALCNLFSAPGPGDAEVVAKQRRIRVIARGAAVECVLR
jgi:hypothetical protein